MLYEILPDPLSFILDAGPSQVLQFHRRIPEAVPVGHFDENGSEIVDEVVSRPDYLDRVQTACAALKDGLEVRFFDHFEEEFDANVLDGLDQIHNLAIDGLEIVRNADAIGRLPRLTSLRFGPRRLENAKELDALGVQRLERFTLAGTPSPAINLAPLADAVALRSLRLLGHGTNTGEIGHLRSLLELAIQPSMKFSLDFINRLVSLESLKFVLGRGDSITSIHGLAALRDLSFREMRLLNDVGDLQRFPSLRRLQISDQPRIAGLQLGPRNDQLQHLYLYSVPELRRLDGLSELPTLKSLFAYDSQLNLTWSELPSTLTHFQLMTRQTRGRQQHEDDVRARGLTPAVHPDAVFFYK